MRGVHGQWRQHREDALGEQLVHAVLFVFGELSPVEDPDALVLEGGTDVLVEDP